MYYRYKGLGIKDIRQFLDEEALHVYKYLPEPSTELPKVPKEWLGDVCATVLQAKFNQWVKQRCDKRHIGIVDKKNLKIQMDPEVAEVTSASDDAEEWYVVAKAERKSKGAATTPLTHTDHTRLQRLCE